MSVGIDETARVKAQATTRIAAPPERVWAILTDLSRWPEWNNDVSRIIVEGPLVPGTRFRWKAGGMTISSQLAEVVAPTRIAWAGRMIGVSAVHVWELQGSGEATTVTTAESFGGWLPALLPGVMRKTLEDALTNGLQKLKARCEQGSA